MCVISIGLLQNNPLKEHSQLALLYICVNFYWMWGRFADEDGMHMLSFSQFCQTVQNGSIKLHSHQQGHSSHCSTFLSALGIVSLFILIHSHGCIARCQ